MRLPTAPYGSYPPGSSTTHFSWNGCASPLLSRYVGKPVDGVGAAMRTGTIGGAFGTQSPQLCPTLSSSAVFGCGKVQRKEGQVGSVTSRPDQCVPPSRSPRMATRLKSSAVPLYRFVAAAAPG